MRRRLLLQVSYASVSNYLTEALGFVRGFGIAKLLGPTGFGVWTAMRLVLTISRFAHAGARGGMLQHASQAAGAGDEELADGYRAVAWGINLAGVLALSAVVAAALVGRAGLPEGNERLWLILAGVLVVQNIFMFYRTVVRSRRFYGIASSMRLAHATLSTGLGLLGALIWGLGGFLVGLGASFAIVTLAIRPFGGAFPKARFERLAASRLLGTGLPIMAGNLLGVMLWNVDKYMLWAFVGSLALGKYAVQSYFTNALILIPAAVTEVFYPHLVAEIGRTGSRAAAGRFLVRGSELMTHVAVPVLAATALSLHVPIRWTLPEYVDAIPPGRVMVLAMIFPVAARIPTDVLISLGGQVRRLALTAVSLVVSIAAIGWAVASGGRFVPVALGATVGLAANCLLMLQAGARLGEVSSSESLPMLGRMVLSLGVMLAASGFAVWSVPFEPLADSLTRDVLATAGRVSVALAILIPWAWWSTRSLRRLPPAAAERMT